MRNDVLLFTAVALATAVEMVEALTIVLAVGVTRGWRATLFGVGAALLALGVIVAALGPAVAQIPLSALRVGVGALLLIFGLQWLRKAILRASGYKALHDEEQIFAKAQSSANSAPQDGSFDGYSFAIAFKGVLLEGLEVVFIVLTFGASQHRIVASGFVALATALLVALIGVVVHKPLSRMPENTLKFVVGPAPLDVRHVLVERGSRGALARRRPGDPGSPCHFGGDKSPVLQRVEAATATRRRHGGDDVTYLRRFGAFWYDFVIGDDWTVAVAVVVALVVTSLVAHNGRNWFWLLPIVVICTLGVSLRRLIRRH